MDALLVGGEIPLSWMIGAFVFLLIVSAFFSIAETAMMAINRYRLTHLVSEGDTSAERVHELLKRTDRLLGGILIGNTLSITGATTVAGFIAAHFFGEERLVVILTPIAVGFIIIVFAEITPKVIGATHPERAALLLSLPVKGALYLLDIPAWFINLFARPMLRLVGIKPGEDTDAPKLSPEEIRTLVLESSSFMPKKHLSILLNLFDLGAITVQDVMVPRARIESICFEDGMETVSRQLATSHHMRLLVFRDHEGEIAGVLHIRKILAALNAGRLEEAAVVEVLDEPYYVPASTSALAQMQYFQEKRERLALVVDEYGELMGLVTLEDIIEEMIGKFTTTLPTAGPLTWDENGTATADGAMPLREVNRALGLSLPTDGPKTLNGLIVEHLQEIPEADVSIKINDVPMEIVHAQGRTIKTVRIFRPLANVENTETTEA
jgi:Mg2+/Co2+ transporter CorB